MSRSRLALPAAAPLLCLLSARPPSWPSSVSFTFRKVLFFGMGGVWEVLSRAEGCGAGAFPLSSAGSDQRLAFSSRGAAD